MLGFLLGLIKMKIRLCADWIEFLMSMSFDILFPLSDIKTLHRVISNQSAIVLDLGLALVKTQKPF
jgi:hypothetical protein